MTKRIYIIAALFCCSCSIDEIPFSVPEIPAAERHAAIQTQLNSARSRAVQQPENADALGRFGMTLQAYGMHEQAEGVYARARQLAPNEFRWAYLHGYALDVIGEDAQARDAFAAAAKIDPKAGSTRLGTTLFEFGEIAAARKTLLKALGYNESDMRALFELGRLEGADGNAGLAEEYLLKSIASGAEHPSIYYALADIKKRQGDEAQAADYLEHFEQLKAKGTTWPDRWLAEVAAMSLSDQRLMAGAVRAIQAGDLRRAVALNEQARELNPDNPLPPAALIGLYAILGDHEKSDDALSVARRLDPDSAQFHYNVGIARMAQNRLADAEAAMLRVTEIDPQGTLAWTKLGGMYAAQGDRDRAIDAFAKAYERDPANDELRLKLGVLYVDAQRYESALELLDAATAGDQNEARRLWALGRAHRHFGNPEQAAVALKSARAAATRVGDRRLAAAVTGELDRLNAAMSD